MCKVFINYAILIYNSEYRRLFIRLIELFNIRRFIFSRYKRNFSIILLNISIGINSTFPHEIKLKTLKFEYILKMLYHI